ncbi:TPA: hypothetical protein ACV8FI_004280 [Escherichia coli]
MAGQENGGNNPQSGRNAAFFINPFQITNIKNGSNRLKTVGTVFPVSDALPYFSPE